jgi:transposase
MRKTQRYQEIPTSFNIEEFKEFVFPNLPTEERCGPRRKLDWHTIVNYILLFLYMGCQWKTLPIEKDANGKPEIHYSNLHRAFVFLTERGVIAAIFVASVSRLQKAKLLDVSVIHGDGTTTAAKKGGDNLGYSGHKHIKGDKVVAFCDRNCNVIAPFITAAGNRNELPLLLKALPQVTGMAKMIGIDLRNTIVSLDGVYDCRANRKAIFNRGMVPNIYDNRRGRKTPKRGRKPFFDPDIFEERFRTIERVFAWEDKFKRLLLRFERISELHYALKTLAYTMINLRHFCKS